MIINYFQFLIISGLTRSLLQVNRRSFYGHIGKLAGLDEPFKTITIMLGRNINGVIRYGAQPWTRKTLEEFQNRPIRIFFFDTFFMNTCEFGDFDFVTIVKGVKASVRKSRVPNCIYTLHNFCPWALLAI